MVSFRIFKAIAALPQTVVANAIYLVRVGAGFDMHVTTSDGVPFKLNGATVKTFTVRTDYDAYEPTDPNEIVLYVGQ